MRAYLCNDSLLCSVGCGVIEDIHASSIYELPMFCAIWSDIISWLRITCVLHDNAISLTSKFCGALMVFCKNIKTCLQAIWLGSNRSIWKVRKDRVFNGNIVTIDKLIFTTKFKLGGGLRQGKQVFVSI
jgi:hypothetical protein